MPLTLAAAAKAVRRDKTTLLRAVKAGKLSAARDEASGAWLIEPAELHRLYPPDANAAVDAPGNAATRHGEDAAAIRELRARLDDAHNQIADLQRRLDRSDEERRQAQAQVSALLTPTAGGKRRWLPWRR